MPRKPSTEKCKTMLKKVPAKKVKGGFGFASSLPVMDAIRKPTFEEAEKAKENEKKFWEGKIREQREKDSKTGFSFKELGLLRQVENSLTDEEKEMLDQFNFDEKNEILRERAKVMGGRMCRGGSASAEGQSAGNRTSVQSIRNAHARVNGLREELEMEALPVPETRAEPEENSTSYNMRLREMLADFLDQVSILERALSRRRARESQSSRGQSEGSSQPRRRLFE